MPAHKFPENAQKELLGCPGHFGRDCDDCNRSLDIEQKDQADRPTDT